jgi:hypothetical protein
MDFSHILAAAAGLMTGVVAVLALVAPRTKNTTDDKILEIATKVKELAEQLAAK